MLQVPFFLLLRSFVIWTYWLWFFDPVPASFTGAVKIALLLFAAQVILRRKVEEQSRDLSFGFKVGIYLATLSVGGIFFGFLWLLKLLGV